MNGHNETEALAESAGLSMDTAYLVLAWEWTAERDMLGRICVHRADGSFLRSFSDEDMLRSFIAGAAFGKHGTCGSI